MVISIDLHNVYTSLGGTHNCSYRQSHSGVTNFRDVALHGFTTTTGRTLKPGFFYRSSRLYEASNTALSTLFSPKQLNINFVADFRSDTESWWAPDMKASNYQHNLYNISDSSTPQMQMDMMMGRINATDMTTIMQNLNVGFAIKHHAHFAQFLSDLLSSGKTPFLIHCTAGKDRTGWASALLLRLLDVSEADIMKDFLTSNCGWDPTARKNAVLLRFFSLFRVDIKTSEALLRVKESYLQSGFDAVRKHYHTWDKYVEEGLGMNYLQLKKDLATLLLKEL